MKNCKCVLSCSIIIGIISTVLTSPLVTKNEDQYPLKVHSSNQEFTSICWAESLIITENKKTKNKTISKSYSILLDTPEKLKELHNESENASCIEILEHNSKPKKSLNFTILKEDKEYVIKEHKTLFCGAGPVLSQHFIVWPKLNRKQIEISINPLSSTKWKNCKKIRYHKDGKKSNSKTTYYKIPKSPNKRQSEETQIPDTTTVNPKYSSEEVDVGSTIGRDTDVVEIPESIETKNIILRRDVNCPVDDLGTCNKMREKSNRLLGYSNSSNPVLAKWFFLDPSDVFSDGDLSYKLKVKIFVDMVNAGSADDEQHTKLVLEEESLYYAP